MTQTAMGGIAELRTLLHGSVLTPADPGFYDRRLVRNAQIDRRPAVIVVCGRRCARTPSAAGMATSTARLSTPATVSAEATTPRNTPGSLRSKPSTTRTTCSTSTPTSRPPDGLLEES